MQEQQYPASLRHGEHVVECAGIERLSSGGRRQQGRAGAIEIERALELIGAALGLSERQRDHELEAALPLGDDPRAMLVERARVVDAGGAAGPGRKARGRPDQLQADIPAREALDPPRNVAQLVVERDRRAIAAPHAETSRRVAIRGKSEPRGAAKALQKCLIERMRVGVYDHLSFTVARSFLVGRLHGARQQVEQAGELLPSAWRSVPRRGRLRAG